MSVFWCGLEYQTIQVNGQRFIGPPAHVPAEPSYDWELFVKNLPRNLFEGELVPLFSTAGFVYQIRLLMCFSGLNRGIAYVRYTKEADFQRALVLFNYLQIGTRFTLHASKSMNLRKLVLLNIEQHVVDQTIRGFIETTSGGICVFIGQRAFDSSKKFAIVQFSCHYETALARRKLMGFLSLFGDDCYLKWYNQGGNQKRYKSKQDNDAVRIQKLN